jgi:hypothetical protein
MKVAAHQVMRKLCDDYALLQRPFLTRSIGTFAERVRKREWDKEQQEQYVNRRADQTERFRTMIRLCSAMIDTRCWEEYTSTDIGVGYTLSRSLPLRLALRKVGPRAGTRNNVARKPKIEKPKEAKRAGSGGAGSSSGLIINQTPTGTRDKRRTGGRGRGASVIMDSDSFTRVKITPESEDEDEPSAVRTSPSLPSPPPPI